MNSKGFNLFSIIVAAVLLMIGSVLISTLISTEDKTSNEIYIMTNNFNLSDAASLARSDSIQTFNYNFRNQIQNFLDYSDNLGTQGFSILHSDDLVNDPNQQMQIIKENFESAILYSNGSADINSFRNVIQLVSESTIANFKEGRYGKYYVSLSDKSNSAVGFTTDAIMRALTDSYSTNTPFLSVVGCDGTTCPIGTFYFNIPLDKIDPNTYEKLPKIVVKDMLTNEETKIGLLPKTNLKIYIPLRFFKAIHHAKDNLEAIKYNEYNFTRARMGFCDDGCNPRKDPVTANPGDRTDASCDAEQNANRYVNINSYYPMGSGMPGSNLLQAFVSEKVCSSFNQTNSFPAMFDNYNTNLLSGNSAISTIPGCPYYSIQATLWGTDVARITGGAADQYLSCTTITSVYADVVFKETNPIYIVRGEEILYKLRLLSNPLSAQTSDHINYECKTSLSPEICERV